MESPYVYKARGGGSNDGKTGNGDAVSNSSLWLQFLILKKLDLLSAHLLLTFLNSNHFWSVSMSRRQLATTKFQDLFIYLF